MDMTTTTPPLSQYFSSLLGNPESSIRLEFDNCASHDIKSVVNGDASCVSCASSINNNKADPPASRWCTSSEACPMPKAPSRQVSIGDEKGIDHIMASSIQGSASSIGRRLTRSMALRA